MLASQAAIDSNKAPSDFHRLISSSPVSISSALLLTIKGMNHDSSSQVSSAQGYIDPKSALSPPSCDPLGQGALLSSSQISQSEEDQLRGRVGDLPAAIIPQADFILSSCDEDAEGEPDESFQSEHSFWMTHPGDTSASTIATLDVDEPPIPLIGRDGTWKGVQSLLSTTRDDKQDKQSVTDDDSQPVRPLTDANKISEPTLLYSTPSRRARQKPASSITGSTVGETSRSEGQKQTKEGDDAQPERPGSSKRSSPTKGASRRQPKRSKLSKSAALSSSIGSEHHRDDGDASSESGSVSGSKSAPSPASSTGRYKLRKKDSVLTRSLAALLTPPRDKLPQSSLDAVNGSAKWLDHIDQELNSEPEAARQPSPSPEEEEEDVKPDMAEGNGAEGTSAEWDELDPDSARPVTVRDKGRRAFPAEWETHPDFPLLYQRYCVPSSVSPEVLEMLLRGLNFANVDEEFHEIVDRAQTVQGTFNKPRSILDLYTPRFVKGVGVQKVGMCPICYEDGRVKFLKTKFSAYNYHMQNFHGVSALTGLPFTPPSKFRTKARPNAKPKERKELVQGFCHSCNKYIDIQGPKQTEVKVAEIYWWKHAQVCHRGAGVPEGLLAGNK
ncbi:related to Meiotic expression upregulated protein 26 [Ustilago trichophora]|uniref:Related to Meiotic expression upregulated protein 26 n=1 Tax=Ustilago trichophora TaxID=86804 RepID=A0A5C3ERX3_9BASI|nr:related to Meiotic expression upregulated protein 26 [Ustilago trichophora]